MSFYNRPDKFSFKDILAIVFSGMFLYFCWKALTSRDALELVRAMIPLISIILAGYFGQEAVSTWVSRRTDPREGEGYDDRGTI